MNVYKIECLTNLHVGSGEVNYSIVDNEVEKDINGYPVIHSSGLKGALREHAEKVQFRINTPPDEKIKFDKDKVEGIFGQIANSGTIKPGSYKFFDGNIISRPMRVSGINTMASISVFTLESINRFLKTASVFGLDLFGGITHIDDSLINFSQSDFVVKADVLSQQAQDLFNKLEKVIGKKYAVVKDFNVYSLPVIARNYLENGISKNLWYEEVVPHGSVFYTLIITPEEQNELDMSEIKQIGGHSSIGYGFTSFTELK